ncbi:cytochrome P450 monooxygenase [Amylocystis lapponica]|nr:cytochrome P450 monooxygenase [Amylocystis lapponica]
MTQISPLVIAPLIGVVTLLAWSFVRRNLSNRALSNVPGPPSSSFWTGNMGDYFDRRGWVFQKKVAEEYGPVVKLHGMLGSMMLYVYDQKALHSVLVKDQYTAYDESPEFITINSLVFGTGLLSTEGEHHRKQRKMLNPVFSVNHMRYMLPIFYQVTGKLRDAITARVCDGPREINMLSWMARTALELIGQGGLGYSLDPLTEDTEDEYATAAKAFLPAILELGSLRLVIRYIQKIGTASMRRRILDLIPYKPLQKVKNIVDTLDKKARTIYYAKKLAFEQGDEAVLRQVGEGKDIMSILMKANLMASEEDRLPESEIIAQMSTLIFAAMDTTSNTLARILHLLAEHPEIQERLRQEIVAARDGEDLSYDTLMQLPYLDAVCRESLRVQPPATLLSREAHKDVVLPLSQPIRGVDGLLMQEVTVPRGTTVIPGVLGWNRSKAIWGEDAAEWKPERWLAPLPSTVTESRAPGVYSHIMSFMGGGRACIGFKFAEMELKVVLVTLLSSFVLEVERPIYWNIAGVRYPTASEDSEYAELPLKVSIWKAGS